ncbi:MAG: hypothetical protein II931_05580 [Clostridia bacterium]|nr:hypothetical protein [Clostridia bacterium]
MKKFLAAALAVLMAAAMTACGSEENANTLGSDYTPPESITVYVESGDTAVPVEIDTSNMSNPFAYNTMVIDLPEGYVADEQTIKDAGMVLAYRGTSTTSTDCYTFADTGSVQNIDDVDKDTLTKDYKGQFEGFTEFSTFEKTKCSGFDAIDIGFDRKIGNAKIYQRQYFILTDTNTYVINYTTEKKKNLEEYEQSLTTIAVK